MKSSDKLNKVDFHWFLVRTLPHQEKKLAGLFRLHQADTYNILEVYCPVHTTVSLQRKGKDLRVPLFSGFVFVHSTRQALEDFMERYYPEGTLLYDRKSVEGVSRPRILTIPERQMRAFMDFNENYAEHVVVLERPYSDYAFNAKTGEPNEIVRVIDGPLAGREGYLTRFRRDKRLVFNLQAPGSGRCYTVSIPHVWNFHVVRLHNAEGDRQSIGTVKERAFDLLAGLLQACGYGGRTLPLLYEVVDTLTVKPSLTGLCRTLRQQGHEALGRRIAGLDTDSAGLLLNLVRYEHDNPGYVRNHYKRLVLRPFLTPTSGVEMDEGVEEVSLQHVHFTEVIRKVNVVEQVYYPSKEKGGTAVTPYYAHIGILPSRHAGGRKEGMTLFANWDVFLYEYFRTSGKANEKLVSGALQAVRGAAADEGNGKLADSFRNYAPTFYKVLTDASFPVKALADFRIGEETLNVLALTATDMEKGKDELIRICVDICREINATTHLAVWRRYLRTVWLHN